MDQLSESWVEGELHKPLEVRATKAGEAGFVTAIATGAGLFGKDPAYWQTVHSGGEGRAKELAEDKVKVRTHLRPRSVGGGQQLLSEREGGWGRCTGDGVWCV